MIIYYTDWHDVDEDWVTLTVQGTAYPDGVEAGVINRRASASPGDTSSHVASVQKKNNRTYSPCGDACSIDEDRWIISV